MRILNKDEEDDMCSMGTLTKEAIIGNLIQRYKKDKIYTNIGPTLISLNPYKELPGLYGQQVIKDFGEKMLSGTIVKEPHIYAVAGRVFQGMLNKVQKQAIIISG